MGLFQKRLAPSAATAAATVVGERDQKERVRQSCAENKYLTEFDREVQPSWSKMRDDLLSLGWVGDVGLGYHPAFFPP